MSKGHLKKFKKLPQTLYSLTLEQFDILKNLLVKEHEQNYFLKTEDCYFSDCAIKNANSLLSEHYDTLTRYAEQTLETIIDRKGE